MNKKEAQKYRHPFSHEEIRLEIIEEKNEKIILGKYYSENKKDIFSIETGIPNFTYPKELAQIDDETRANYEKLANEYDKFANIPFNTFKTDEKEIREKMTDQLNIQENSIVLEVGAGDGRGSEHIVKRLGKNGKLFVQELSPAFLNKAIERLKPYNNHTSIEYSVASAMFLPFADNTFDAAHHFGGFNTFSDQQRALCELARVVKPGGKIVIGDESMAPWLRDKEMGKIMMNSNPLLKYEIPFDIIPIESRDVKIEWVMLGAFFILEFTVGEGEPKANYYINIPSGRGGNHWTRYFGNLEGVTDETKHLALKAVEKSDKSMHEWLDEIVKKEAEKILKNNMNNYE